MALMKLKIPTNLLTDPKKLLRAVDNGLKATAKAIVVDFKVTTQTWQHKPMFKIEEAGALQYIIGTDDDVYHYVSGGTRPHIITPKSGKVLAFGPNSRAKTRVRSISSGTGGSGGGIVYAKIIHHPGNEAREFDETIAEKWQKLVGANVQRAIDSEV